MSDQTPETPDIDRRYDYSDLIQLIEKTSIVNEVNQEWSIQELDIRITEALRKTGEACRIANGGVICLTLSGGIDSTLALAILRGLYPEKRIMTVTMGGSTEHPDVQYARLAAQKFSSEHHEFIPTLDQIDESIREYQFLYPHREIKEAVDSGDHDVYLLYDYLARQQVKAVIALDGLDEQMGGYWPHRQTQTGEEKKSQFKKFWAVLLNNHIRPLIHTAQTKGIRVFFPYLDERVIEYSSRIPLDERTDKEQSKKPIRILARLHGVPEEIIDRSKCGQFGMLFRENNTTV
jgi:asparagine synthetase B (glutamine-hydrolysing)